MRDRTIRRYYDAAKQVWVEKGRNPTRAEIARKLGSTRGKIRVKLGTFDADILGCIDYRLARKVEYRASIPDPDKGATYAEIARASGRRYQSVYQYLKKNPDAMARISASDALKDRYREARKRIVRRGARVTRKELAYELDIPYKTVCTYLTDNPDLVRELDVGDTYGRTYGR